MDSVVLKYIQQVTPDPLFSPWIYLEANFNEATHLLNFNTDFNERGANLIIFHALFIEIPVTTLGTFHQLVDNYGQVLLSFEEVIQFSGQYYFKSIMNSALFKLTLTNSLATTIKMTAQIQYVYNKEHKNL
jgi:hypothetical protein